MGGKKKMTLDQAIKYYDKLTNDALMHGMHEEAKRFREKSRNLQDELMREKLKTVKGRRELAQAYNRLGDTAYGMRLFTKAGAYYKKSYDLWRTLAEDVESDEILHELFGSCKKMMTRVCRTKAEMLIYLNEMLEISRKLAKRRGSRQDIVDLQFCYYNLGNIYCRMWSIENTKKGKKMLRIAIRISKKNPDAQLKSVADRARNVLRDIIGTKPEDYEERGLKALQHGIIEEAYNCYKKAVGKRVNYAAEISDYPEFVKILNDLLSILRIAEKQEKYAEAEKYCRIGSEIAREIVRNYGDIDAYLNDALFCQWFGILARAQGKYGLAIAHYAEAIAILNKAPQTMRTQIRRLHIHNQISDTIELLGMNEEAETYYRKALDYATELVQKYPSETTYNYLLLLYHSLGMLSYLQHKDQDVVNECFGEIIRISEEHREYKILEKLRCEVKELL